MSDKIQKINCNISHIGGRIETGAVQFNEDWPGIFIRGDNAAHLSMCWQMLQKNLPKEILAQFYIEISTINGFLGEDGAVRDAIIT